MKKSRCHDFNDIYLNRLSLLNSILENTQYSSIRENVVLGEQINISGERYAAFEFISSLTCYKLLRGKIIRKNNIFLILLKFALDFCHKLNNSVENHNFNTYREIWELFISSHETDGLRKVLDRTIDGLENVHVDFSIVHNDLCPANVLVKENKYWVLDWEYWDMSLSIFNFFDVMLSFGSVALAGIFEKRGNKNLLNLFNPKLKRKNQILIKTCGEHASNAGYSQYDSNCAESLFLLYLMNKSVCQYRVYHQHYELDYFWYGFLKEYIDHREGFKIFWQNILQWQEL